MGLKFKDEAGATGSGMEAALTPIGCWDSDDDSDDTANAGPHEAASTFAIFNLGADGLIESWNEAAGGIVGYSERDAIGSPFSMLFTVDGRGRDEPGRELRQAASQGCRRGEYLFQRSDGAALFCDVIVTAIRDGRERLSGYTCVMHDASARLDIETRLAEERERNDRLLRTARYLFREREAIRSTLTSIGDGVIVTDATGAVTFLNPVAEALTGWNSDDARGESAREVFHIVHEGGDTTDDPVRRALDEQRVVSLADDMTLINRDGRRFAVADSCAPVRDSGQQITGAVLVFRDVTELRNRARAVQHEATHDALTGLVNRSEFERRLERVLHTARTDQSHVLFYLDLDRFKAVNDNCGHLAGDELLRQVAALLRNHIRHRDTLARLGGDEFALLLEHCSVDQARRIADSIRSALLAHRFAWQGRLFGVGVSIGVLPLTEQGWTAAQALGIADAACYAAKNGHGKGICVHEPDLDTDTPRHGLRYWENRIQQAIADNRFRLHFQPIVPISIGSSAALHGEVLLRLEDDDSEIVEACEFLPPAERNRQLVDIDRWVVRNVISALNTLRPPTDGGPILLSVNISAPSLATDAFHDFVVEQLARLTLPMAELCFEVTESAATADLAATLRFASRLRRLHCRLALDHFGTGLSSFGYLRTLPVDYLKINDRFIRDMVSDPVDAAMVETIHNIGHMLGIRTVAAAVETGSMLEGVRRAKLDYAQGFGIARPQPLDQALASLEAQDS